MMEFKRINVREAFCKNVVGKLSELDKTLDGTVNKWWNVAA